MAAILGTRSTYLSGENAIAQIQTRSVSTKYISPWLSFVRVGENLRLSIQLLQIQVRRLLTWTTGAQRHYKKLIKLI